MAFSPIGTWLGFLAAAPSLLLLYVADNRRLGKGKENDLLAGCGADIMVQGQHLDAGDLLDHRFHDRTGRFDQMGLALASTGPALSRPEAT